MPDLYRVKLYGGPADGLELGIPAMCGTIELYWPPRPPEPQPEPHALRLLLYRIDMERSAADPKWPEVATFSFVST